MFTATVNSSIPLLSYLGYALVGTGVIGIVALLILISRRDKKSRGGASRFVVLFVILIIAGVPLFAIHSIAGSVSTITVGDGYIQVSGPFIGNNNYTASQISYAFVENLHTGNLSLSVRTGGTSLGSLHEGRFTLSNGAGAHVVTDNATVLVIEMKSGLYLVLGTPNTDALVSAFNSDVFPTAGMSSAVLQPIWQNCNNLSGWL